MDDRLPAHVHVRPSHVDGWVKGLQFLAADGGKEEGFGTKKHVPKLEEAMKTKLTELGLDKEYSGLPQIVQMPLWTMDHDKFLYKNVYPKTQNVNKLRQQLYAKAETPEDAAFPPRGKILEVTFNGAGKKFDLTKMGGVFQRENLEKEYFAWIMQYQIFRDNKNQKMCGLWEAAAKQVTMKVNFRADPSGKARKKAIYQLLENAEKDAETNGHSPLERTRQISSIQDICLCNLCQSIQNRRGCRLCLRFQCKGSGRGSPP